MRIERDGGASTIELARGVREFNAAAFDFQVTLKAINGYGRQSELGNAQAAAGAQVFRRGGSPPAKDNSKTEECGPENLRASVD